MHPTNGDFVRRRAVKGGSNGVGLRVIGICGRNVMTWVTAAAAAAALVAPVAAQTSDPTALARTKKCMNCHALDQKLVGPAFKAVAARYAADKEAEDRLAKKIRLGGVGAWGVVPMPTNDVSDAEARVLAHWVLQQK